MLEGGWREKRSGWEVEVQKVKTQEGDMSLQLDIVMLGPVGAEWNIQKVQGKRPNGRVGKEIHVIIWEYTGFHPNQFMNENAKINSEMLLNKRITYKHEIVLIT